MSIQIDPEQQKNEETTKLRYITPVIQAKWQDLTKVLMEYYFTDGRISIDEYNIAHRGKPQKVDYLLLHKDYIPLAVVEAKGIDHRADEGYSQAIEYARLLDVPFAYATNGDVLIEHDMLTGLNKTMKMADFPTREELWERYTRETNMDKTIEMVYTEPYYITSTGKKPRYYQRIAINRAVKHIADGDKRLLIVLATGTGKTFTSFQIIYRFWHTRQFKKVLYLADRNILIDQTMKKDFKPFLDAMEKIDNKKINTSKEIFLGLYQQLVTADKEYYTDLPRDFFDLIVVDECHRGSASDDSNWHKILNYFSSAVQIGMTATPKDGGVEEARAEENEIKEQLKTAMENGDDFLVQKLKVELDRAIAKRQKAESESNVAYFGNPIYTYSLKQGIEDGFLAPYKVVSVELNVDKYGWHPPIGTVDVNGNPVENRLYTQDDFDRKIVSPERRALVAKRITEFLKTNDMRCAKTIVFCEDVAHCEEMVRLLENENADLVAEDSRYIMQITGDNQVGKAQLDNFVDPSSKYPVIAVTSKLMSTGVDAETCEVIVLDRKIGSMTEFKQIIGRGTRIRENYEVDGEKKSKTYFTVLDFRRNYLKFNDPKFDGTPITVTSVDEGHEFPEPPHSPVIPSEDAPKHTSSGEKKTARVNGIDVEIVGEDVLYYDASGNLVTQDLNSCTRNNIISQYPTFEDFKKAWLIANDKARFASELLLGINWEDSFEIRYGYAVDNFDIIAYFGYDIEPPMSKNQRMNSGAISVFLESMGNVEIKKVARILLDAYVEANFANLKDVRNIFSMRQFREIDITPQRAMKLFGGKSQYYKFLAELENKLYE